ncbi:hypothetical protein AAG906_031786 [Vitis piasezkii]
MRRALSARLSLSSIMMIERTYSVFLCFLLISVLFFPLAAAGRVLLGTPQKGDEGGDHSNGRSKIDVKPSHSGQAGSALGHSSPPTQPPPGYILVRMQLLPQPTRPTGLHRSHHVVAVLGNRSELIV